MILYLRDEGRHRIDKIELVDGFFPTITADIDAFGSNNINILAPNERPIIKPEPAIWSLILVVDKIFVDCSRRRFSWTTTGSGEINDNEDFDDPSCKTQFVEDECYEYNDDVDQVFNLAQHLIKSSSLRTTISRKTQEYLNRVKDEQYSLIRMLYCYILPKVEFQKRDHLKVQEAIRRQTASIHKIDADIEIDSKKLDELYQDLRNQQDRHLSEFEELFETKKCTKEFVKIFENDLNKRIEHLNEELDAKQTIVHSIKMDISKNGETPEKTQQLAVSRKESKNCNATLQNLLMVSRDTIKTAMLEGDSFLHQDTEEIILEYLETMEKSKQQKIAARNQIDKKVHAKSILENLRRIEKDVVNDGKASSTGISSSGITETDVNDPDIHVLPEFETLPERVFAIVRNPEHPLGAEFQKFVVAIRERCGEIVNDTKMTASRKRKSKLNVDNYMVVSRDGTIQEEYLWPLENLCCCIKEHFHVMSINFHEHFSSTSTVSTVLKNKLQLYYEENFYEAVGEDIAEVYRIAHLHHMEKMTSDLELLSTFPIDCLKLGMKDEWWLELFEKRRKAIVRSRRSSFNTGSLGSLLDTDMRMSSSSSSGSSSSLPVSIPDATTRKQLVKKTSSGRIKSSFLSVVKRISRNVSETSLGLPPSGQVDNGDDRNSYNRTPADFLSESPEESSYPMEYQAEVKKFEEYFGPSLACLKEMFTVAPVFSKLRYLTSSLRQVTKAVEELRRQVLQKSAKDDDISLAITGDDILPLIVLMILQMDPDVAAALQSQLKMLGDLIPKFLSAGCHGWAMMEFEMACQVLQSLCNEYKSNDTPS